LLVQLREGETQEDLLSRFRQGDKEEAPLHIEVRDAPPGKGQGNTARTEEGGKSGQGLAGFPAHSPSAIDKPNPF
jgi:hypothetical protein